MPRASYLTRCIRCRLHLERCICAHIPRLETQTRIILVSHRRELSKVSNTAHYTTLALSNTEAWRRGAQTDPPVALPSDRTTLLLFPYDEAVPLTADFVGTLTRPVSLVVPDGTWQQARRMARREPALAALPQVSLPAERQSRYAIRRQHRLDGLSTFEAIARCLGLLEGDWVERQLDTLFDLLMLEMCR